MKSKPRTPRALACGVAAALAAGSTASAQLELPTSFGDNGADAFLTNDGNRPANQATGDRTSLEIRNYPTVRQKIGIIRFDISALDPASNNAGATIRLNQAWGSDRTRTWLIYGLRDGHSEMVYDPGTAGDITVDEFWDESTTSYDLAPGILDSNGDPTDGKGLNNAPEVGTILDIYDAGTNPTGAWELVGTATDYGISTGSGPTEAPAIDLQSFLDADTNGVVTLLLTYEIVNNGASFGITTKEEAPPVGSYPALILPNGTFADADMDGLPKYWEEANSLDDSDDTGDNGATGDPDMDTFDNAAEFAAGTDPQDNTSVPGDLDADGLQDLWEDANFGNNDGIIEETDLLPQDGSGDPDQDWGTNAQEQEAGTDPRIVDELGDPVDGRASFLDNENGDGTGDGQNDWWEIQYFGDIATSTAGSDNPDADADDNDAEYAAYSNPNDANSVPGDIDGDMVPDLWEDQHFGNNDGIVTDVNAAADLDGTDGTGDPDEDTFNDLAEATAMPVPSDPNNAASVPGDADADDLDDQYELDIFGDIATQTGLQDSDGDGYRNSEEANADPQTDASDPDSFIDTDEDGQPDRWEIRYFGDLTTSDDPFDDIDNDFEDNFTELLSGSDPNNAASTFEDIDADGVMDDFELTYYTNVWDQDGSSDTDGDFSTLEEEETAMTVPIDATSAPDIEPDNLGDAWEIWCFGDTTTTDDSAADNDGDGEDNATEFANLTNANDPLSTSDSDTDRLSDGWELNYFIQGGEDPVTDREAILARQTGADDSDMDGAINLLEQRLGTDPTDDGDTPDPALLPTSLGLGADIDLANDTQNAGTGPTVMNGLANGMALRYIEGVRVHIPMVRFDASLLGGDLSGAMLQLNTTFESGNNTQTVEVYALMDGADGEDWDEGTTSYSTSPGLLFGEELTISTWSRDPQQMRLVGTMVLPPNGLGISDPRNLDLQSVLEADTDGLVTLAFFPPGGGWYGISTKEDGADLAPTLIVPNGTVSEPAGELAITAVSFDPDTNTYTMTVSGLAIGSDYYIESGVALDDFATVVGSTFTAASDPQDVPVTADEAADPDQFFRICEGAEPAP